MAEMTRRERLQATIKGDQVDRPAVALWRHFPGDDQRPADLAWATLQWQATWDWDFIKVSPASSFCLLDWGATDRWVGGDEGNREYVARPVSDGADWARIAPLPVQGSCLGRQIEALQRLRDGLAELEDGDDIPYIQTVFSPLAQAKNLAGGDRLITHIRRHPEQVHAALEAITETTIGFIAAAKAMGIAGIYYAIQMANYPLLSETEYRTFGEPYDRRILATVADLWFNMAHLHGRAGMFDLVADYPVQALNWHDQESGPSLRDGAARFPGAVCGGLEHWDDILRGDPELLRAKMADAVAQTGARRLIISSGCVAPVNAPFSNLRTIRAGL